MATENDLIQLGCETVTKTMVNREGTTVYKFRVNYYKLNLTVVGTDLAALIDEAYEWLVTDEHITNYNALNLFSGV
jgi:hypothetical protein